MGTRTSTLPPPSSRPLLSAPLSLANRPSDPRQADERSVIHLVNFRWLTALRWAAVVGQTLAIAFVHVWMEVPLPLLPLAWVILAELCVNFVAMRLGMGQRTIGEGLIAAFVVLDLVAFTALLFFTGGPSNPFSFFYIVHVSMAALFLSQPYAWSLVGLSVASYSALFVWHLPLVRVVSSWDVHLHGIWVAYGLGATCVVYFIQRARAEILEREALLKEEAQLREEAERLSSLATLAAGAAHELASPLGTIAVISKELEYELSRDDGQTTALEDVRVVRSQVERCRKILTRMAHTAGEAPGESDAWVATTRLVQETVDELPDTSRLRLQVDERLQDSELKCPQEALVQALRVLLDNALDASKGNVEMKLTPQAAGLEISVADTGPGIAAPVLKRVFDPFFTTKAPGKGMGLGLYLARNVVTGMGGSLSLDSRLGLGTTARVRLPAERLRLHTPTTDE